MEDSAAGADVTPADGAETTPAADASATERRAAHAARAARAQAAANERVRAAAATRTVVGSSRDGTYAGLVTRAIAYVIDILIINVVALLVGAGVGLALSIFHLSGKLDPLVAAVLAGVYVLWTIGYFAGFWATTGQTPGARTMRIRVIDSGGAARVKPRHAIVRFGGLVLATIPLFAGFWMMLWTRHRRCLQDYLGRTLVVHAPPQVKVVRRAIAAEIDAAAE